MSKNTERTETDEGAEILLGVMSALLYDRLSPTISHVFRFGAERHPDDAVLVEWFNGALYGMAAMFGRRLDEEPEPDTESVRSTYAALCRVMEDVWNDYDGDLNRYSRDLLARVGVDVEDEGHAHA